MRICIRLVLALVFAAAFPALLCAQFQEPTTEELKMTADPKAPGASAVYLYREERTDDLLHFHTYYSRIKVLTEKGKELATVQIPYEKGKFQVAAIQGRTIHPDGTVIPLTAKPSDLLDFKGAGRQFNQMVFTLPSVEVGSILEYRLQLRYSDDALSSPDWIIQQPYYIHKAHYFFNPDYNNGHVITNSRGEVLDGLMYSRRLGPGEYVVKDSQNRFTLDLTDIPALPDEDWMPPLNSIRYSVDFFYTSANSGNEFWEKEGRFWAKNADHFASPSGSLKSAVAGIVSAGDSEDAKARKIYAAVMKIKNTDFIANSSNAHSSGNKDASGVWKQQSGSSDEIAMLYVALARAAGLKAWPMEVVNRKRATYDPTYLSMSQFDDYIAIVQIGGNEIYLDPGEKLCSFGTLHWQHELAHGIRMTDKGTAIEMTPAGTPKSASIQRTADLTVDEHGAVSGTVRMVMNGQEALYWRQLAQVKEATEVGNEFSESIRSTLPDGVQANFSQFEGLDGFDSDLVAVAKVSGSLGSATGKRLILPGLFFEARGKYPFVSNESRTAPIDHHFATMEQDEATYRLPAEFKIDSSPKAANVSWGDHGTMTVRSSMKDGSITISRALVRNSAVLDAGYYKNLREFYQSMSEADQQQVVLVHTGSGI